MPTTIRRGLGVGGLCLCCCLPWLAGQNPLEKEPPVSGPSAEKRFPPLKLPAGFKATLFACDPMIEYPSVIALGPRRGSLFVAADYMTGLGEKIVRRDEVHLLEDTDGDGYADRVRVIAKEFNSIQGLAYHGDTLYVMHAPYLTALRIAANGEQVVQRRDLLTGLGLTPEKNPTRLHCANGVVVGHDGWLYLAMGDNGCDVPRPGMSNLVLHGGGILRVRPDGSHVHVFATGLRNIYDIALDEDLNVFVRDNENDGGEYMIRVCHSFFGADHGYPYLYYEHPQEAMPPLADLGLGSSAGGLCYLEALFPPEYRGNLFFCEWGKSVVRYRPERSGSGFAKLKELVFASGADNDPYPFKPTDLVVDHDGALLVADWADGQRPKRGRGRIYRITPTEKAKAKPESAGDKTQRFLAQLDADSYYQRIEAQASFVRQGKNGAKMVAEALRQGKLGVRGRMHVVWVLAEVNRSVRELLDMARGDAEPRIQVQALRAAIDLACPGLGTTREEAAKFAAEFAEFAKGKDPRVVLEVVLALGQLEWAETPNRLPAMLTKPDPTLEHAAMWAMRRSQNWPAVLTLLDMAEDDIGHVLALRALAGKAELVLVDGLIERLPMEKNPGRRLAYAEALTRVHKKPGPWVYWGYRPPPRPPNSVAWERTAAIEDALDRVLADPDAKVRLAILGRLQREKIPIRLETLRRWLAKERQADSVAAILQALQSQPPAKVRELLTEVVRAREQSSANRLLALAMLVDHLGKDTVGPLSELIQVVEDGPVLAGLFKNLGKPLPPSVPPMLLGKLSSPSPDVRAAALEVLLDLGNAEVAKDIPKLLDDDSAQVRRVAAMGAGKLEVRPAIDLLLKRVGDVDPHVRRASLDALRKLGEPRVVPLAAALKVDLATELSALECLTQLGGPEHAKAVIDIAKRNASAEILNVAVRALTAWNGRKGLPEAARTDLDLAVTEIQGTSGILSRWDLAGPLGDKEAESKLPHFAKSAQAPFAFPDKGIALKTQFASGLEGRVNLGKTGQGIWIGFSDVWASNPISVQFLGTSGGPYCVWLNGRPAFQRDQAGPFQPDADRFSAKLDKGLNRIVFHMERSGTTSTPKDAEFQLRFRRFSSKAEHEKLTQAALSRKGSAERGRKVFIATEKSQCLKCHRLDNQGERVGPDLTGVGGRFSRIYLIESILEPSRTIAPSFDSVVVELNDGRLLTGIPIGETETTLTIADNQGQKHALAKTAIAERRRHPLSTMPEGLEQRLSEDEFVDLIAFLVSQKGGGDR